MTPKQLIYFTGRCLALDEHPEFRDQIIALFAGAWDSISFLKEEIQKSPEEIDLDKFVEMCSDHLIIPAIYLKFKTHDILAYLPEELTQAMKAILDLNRERNIQILRQIDDITALLNKENIQPVFLKGTANLLDGIYSDIGERMIGDIDFLVKEEDYLKTAELLKGVGYFNQELNDGANILMSHHHYPVLTKNGTPADVEIHRVPVVEKYAGDFTSEAIFSQRNKIDGKANTFVPSDKHKAIHTFIHSQLSNSGHQEWDVSLRDLYDASLISKRVNLVDVLNTVDEKFKAQVFCFLISRTFNLELDPGISNNSKVISYIKRYDWWMDHLKLYSLYFRIIEITQLIFVAYLGKLIKSVYSKTHRKYIWIRISNPQWYKAHFLLVKKKFSN